MSLFWIYSIKSANTLAGEPRVDKGPKTNFKIYSAVTMQVIASDACSSQNAFDIAQPFKDQNGSYRFSHSSA